MKIIDTLKQREHRPLLILVGLILVYLWFFSWPELEQLLESFRVGLDAQEYGFSAHFQCLWSLLNLLCVLADHAIWILSVIVTWAAFRKCRKKAYVFILAYLLLPLVLQPSSHLIHRLTLKQRLKEYEQLQAPCELAPSKAESPHPCAAITVTIVLPVGPLLLLAGLWYLYKKEETKKDEASSGGDSSSRAGAEHEPPQK